MHGAKLSSRCRRTITDFIKEIIILLHFSKKAKKKGESAKLSDTHNSTVSKSKMNLTELNDTDTDTDAQTAEKENQPRKKRKIEDCEDPNSTAIVHSIPDAIQTHWRTVKSGTNCSVK